MCHRTKPSIYQLLQYNVITHTTVLIFFGIESDMTNPRWETKCYSKCQEDGTISFCGDACSTCSETQ